MSILFSEMTQRIKHHCRLALCLLMFLAVPAHGTRDILSETCEDQHGADLNGKLYTYVLALIHCSKKDGGCRFYENALRSEVV